ncbi:MAG TPA: 3-methyl-2-oxobutanoate hydroxymethyltransferase [Actinobacteria bacterium]|nr:3-methyl-2-oxobutanoate hydroxymethyltransferase [Actinomycetota bacterium]
MSITVRDIRSFKERGERFVMLTAYDFPTARILDAAGIPILLVGDSLANNVLGYETTLPVTMDEMLHHTRAVARGAHHALIVGDLPFLSYQVSTADGIRNAGRFLKEAGAHAVKLEGPKLELTAALVDLGIPVMGHLGLTPQSVHAMGGYRVQGRTEEEADRLFEDALGLQKSGIFALVLEGVPATLAKRITEASAVPTIGIGAGPHCDGQVLVSYDAFGLFQEFVPPFVKRYANLGETILSATAEYIADVQGGRFPAARKPIAK